MGLFGISRELQFRVCNHGKPCANPCKAREGDHFYRREKKVGRAIVNRVRGFSWAEFLLEKESFFFCWAMQLSQGVRAPPSGSPNLIEVSVY